HPRYLESCALRGAASLALPRAEPLRPRAPRPRERGELSAHLPDERAPSLASRAQPRSRLGALLWRGGDDAERPLHLRLRSTHLSSRALSARSLREPLRLRSAEQSRPPIDPRARWRGLARSPGAGREG